jgi:hypothetical protein
MTKQANSTVASARPTRTPVTQRNRLAIRDKEDGFVYRIVNDIDDRVSGLQELGYELVSKESVGAVGNKKVDSATSVGSVAHFPVGQGVKAVVMRQKKEWYDQDQSAKQAEINALESTMRSDARKAADYGTLDVTK